MASASVDMAAGAAFYATTGTFTSIALSGTTGNLWVAAATVLTALYNTSAGIVADIATNGTGVTTIENCGGTIIIRGRNIATYNGDSSGKLTLRDAAAITTRARMGRGHIINNQSSGTIAILDALPGSKYPCDGTVSTHTITTLNRYSGSYINQYPPVGTITITTDNPTDKTVEVMLNGAVRPPAPQAPALSPGTGPAVDPPKPGNNNDAGEKPH